MTGEMGVLTKHEVEKLMKKLSRERARVLKEFVEKNNALEVGEERFQCHLASLPDTSKMREMMGECFHIYETINGWIIKRLR